MLVAFVTAMLESSMLSYSRDSRRPVRMIMLATAAMPMPPSWIRTRMITWPSVVISFPMSKVAKPVTQTAEVAMNTASTKVISPFTVTPGIESEAVPAAISARNNTAIF